MAFKRISINGPQFFETIVKPNFGELVPDQAFRNGVFGEFMVMDDVPDSRKIIDITPVRNILKRRDASCALTYDAVGSANTRRISTTELYGATTFCRNEFYQGALKEWRNQDPLFVDKIVKYFRDAIKADLISNTYFGDVARVPQAGDKWSTGIYDGLFTQYKKYVADATIPGAQTFNVAAGAMTGNDAKNALENLVKKQDELLSLMGDSEKAIYIDKAWADAYEDYLIATGATNGSAVNFVQDGITTRAYKGIPIFVNPFFNPILNQVVGAGAHFGVLTVRGNFVFATDSSYGEGPSGDQAFVVWYDFDTVSWKYQIFMKGGTQIALPEHSVLALPA